MKRNILIGFFFILLTILIYYQIDYSTDYIPKKLNCKFKNNEIIEGKNHFSQSRVAVCGLLRDKGYLMRNIKENINRLISQFADYKIYIIENDSVDDTREKLLKWANEDNKIEILGCGLNASKCNLSLTKTTEHSIDYPRIKKMVDLRNVYMDKISNEDFDYVVMLDMDLVAYMYLDGLWNSASYFLKYPYIDSICANGVWANSFQYHDSFAHKEEGVNSELQKGVNDLWCQANLKYKCGDGLQRVTSCFSGFTIYRYNSIKNNRYSFQIDKYGDPLCEHVTFNRNLNYVYLNPQMYFIILQNDL